jgi:Uma2 family endonuclease
MTQTSSRFLTVNEFIDQYRYQPSRQFRGSDPIISVTFPDLRLTAAQVFASANR